MKPVLLKELENDDYTRDPGGISVRVPHRVFRLDLEIEENRLLSASESAFLGCLATGPAPSTVIARGLGLPDARLMQTVAVRLLKRNAIWAGESGFEMTDVGRMLARAGELRESRHIQREVRFVPATREFTWFVADELPNHGKPDITLEIPEARDMDGVSVKEHAQFLQLMLEREGLPMDDAATLQGRRDLLGIRVLGERLATTEAFAEVWRHETGSTRLRILRSGIEDSETSKLYRGWVWDRQGRRFMCASSAGLGSI